ncbi:hypothetical protein EX30DRAFT_337579 [Ascodesmis nigricans]|uniref:N-acetyltransferase domain-containing protein n=1 Tax=Ascodesmis nigricans TaxID=341454 RepID=A0A4S2N7C9_9PEZI|nr:hypothetical protein EX30DRAFT_337579 [Ascodesmis nigricans]
MTASKLPHPTQPHIFISTDRTLLDLPMIHTQLSTQQYWSLGIPLPTVQTAIHNSLCLGLYDNSTGSLHQIGFARWVTDYACFGCLSDVFILPEYRGKGLGAWLVQEAVKMTEIRMCRRLMLVTRDPGFYEKLEGEKWVRAREGEEETGVTTMEIRRNSRVLYKSSGS